MNIRSAARRRPALLSSALLFTAMAGSAMAAGVTVGNSSLIGQLDYSDTFTLGTGTRATLAVNAFPIGSSVPAALGVENNYGNPARTWSNSLWSISNDGNAINGGTVYPGGSGAGSASGMTQTGGGEMNYGLEYNLRNDFVVQFDAVQVADRVNLTIGNTRDSIFTANGLSIFFRRNGHATLPEVGIFNNSVGEIVTSFDTGLGLGAVDLNEWHNYAARFNLVTNEVTLWVDQVMLGMVDLDTLGGLRVGGGIIVPGAYAAALNGASNDAISVGSSGGDRTWTDNFQVGAAVPEPGVALLALFGACITLRRRR